MEKKFRGHLRGNIIGHDELFDSHEYQNPFKRDDISLVQWVGLLDYNDNEVYEHDVVMIKGGRIYAIVYKESGFVMTEIHNTKAKMEGKIYFSAIFSWKGRAYLNVIGSLYDKKYIWLRKYLID